MKSMWVCLYTLSVVFICGSAFGADGSLPGSGSSENPYQIEDELDFQTFADPANAATYWAAGIHTVLAADINLAGLTYTAAPIAPDTDASSVNWQGTPYKGFFHGNGFEISNLTIDDQDDCNNNVGLFGRIEGGTVEDLGIINCSLMIGDDNAATRHLTGYIGALCGNFYGGTVSNCYVTGSIRASSHCVALTTSSTSSAVISVGGLCGSFMGTMDDCYSTCTVNASASDYYSASIHSIGGLCGVIAYPATISNSFAAGAVTIDIPRFSGGHYTSLYRLENVGGLIGQNDGVIQNCYSSGSVQCSVNNHNNGFASSIGGLIGYNKEPIYDSYSTSSISISAVGDASSGQCYRIGGLIGNNRDIVDNCYVAAEFSATASSNNYTSTSNQGGLIGINSGAVTASFWDTEVSQMATSAAGTPKNTAEMTTESTFTSAGWDFDATDGAADWSMPGGYPKLVWEPVERVDLDELGTLAQYWLATGCTSDQPCADADWYTDGKINLLDFAQLVQSWLATDMIYTQRADIVEDFETGDFSALDWQFSGSSDWVIVSDPVHEGTYSAQTGVVSHNQRTDIYFTEDTTGFDSISFAFKVSTEADWDYLYFYIDGMMQERWAGDQDWQVVTFPITDAQGEHTFMWTYARDASGAPTVDTAWIDNVTIFKAEE